MQSSSQIVTTNRPTLNVLQGRSPFCHPTNGVRALKGKISTVDIWNAKYFPLFRGPCKLCSSLQLWVLRGLNMGVRTPQQNYDFVSSQQLRQIHGGYEKFTTFFTNIWVDLRITRQCHSQLLRNTNSNVVKCTC